MKILRLYLHLTIAVALGAANSTFVQAASDDHDHDHGVHATEDTQHSESENHKNQSEHGDTDSQSHDDEENTSRIENDMAAQVGIGTTVATKQTLHQSITSYGVLSTGPEQLSHMRARFSGLITSVKASIGDTVKAGDLLAEVESDASLKKYSVLAPISGTIVQRHANTGEVTKDQVLFSIADFDTLWSEFRIYPAQIDNVAAGQAVEIISDTKRITGRISHIIPALDKPYQLARVPLDNRQLELSPGLLVEGRIMIDEFSVPLAVEKNSVQQLGGRSGVFIQEGDTYNFSPLVLGRKDEHYVEVLSGLEESQRYVNRNSYLIKADIEKSEAEHEH